jgi:hypothetical protein
MMIFGEGISAGCGRTATNALFLAAELRIPIYVSPGVFLALQTGLG